MNWMWHRTVGKREFTFYHTDRIINQYGFEWLWTPKEAFDITLIFGKSEYELAIELKIIKDLNALLDSEDDLDDSD